MPTSGVSVKGLNEVVAAIRKSKDSGMLAALLEANRDAAETVVDRATPLAPYRHGDLRHSLRASATQRAGRAKLGNARVPYAAAIHWGRKVGNVGSPPGNHKGRNPIRGRPFLTETAQKSRRDVAVDYGRAIDRIVVNYINRSGA